MLEYLVLGWCGLMVLRAIGQLALVFIAHEVHRLNGYPNATLAKPHAPKPVRPQRRVLPGGRA